MTCRRPLAGPLARRPLCIAITSYLATTAGLLAHAAFSGGAPFA